MTYRSPQDLERVARNLVVRIEAIVHQTLEDYAWPEDDFIVNRVLSLLRHREEKYREEQDENWMDGQMRIKRPHVMEQLS